MKVISPNAYEQLPQEIKDACEGMAKDLLDTVRKPYKFKRMLQTICEKMYNEGVASVVGGDVVENGRCLVIERGTKWFIDCPHCGNTLEIDVESMLPKEEGYSVKI